MWREINFIEACQLYREHIAIGGPLKKIEFLYENEWAPFEFDPFTGIHWTIMVNAFHNDKFRVWEN